MIIIHIICMYMQLLKLIHTSQTKRQSFQLELMKLMKILYKKTDKLSCERAQCMTRGSGAPVRRSGGGECRRTHSNIFNDLQFAAAPWVRFKGFTVQYNDIICVLNEITANTRTKYKIKSQKYIVVLFMIYGTVAGRNS